MSRGEHVVEVFRVELEIEKGTVQVWVGGFGGWVNEDKCSSDCVTYRQFFRFQSVQRLSFSGFNHTYVSFPALILNLYRLNRHSVGTSIQIRQRHVL